jgi:hypothetical protein
MGSTFKQTKIQYGRLTLCCRGGIKERVHEYKYGIREHIELEERRPWVITLAGVSKYIVYNNVN